MNGVFGNVIIDWEHLIRDDTDYRRHVDYVHMNPLKHGLIKQESAWPHSTCHRYVSQGVYPADWCGNAEDAVAGDT